MFLALRELRFDRGRFSLIAAVVGLVAVLATLLSGLASGLADSGISGIERLPVSNLAFSPGSGAVFSASQLSPGALSRWRQVAEYAAPVGVSFVNGSDSTGARASMALFGADPGSGLFPPAIRGSAPGPGELLVSTDMAASGIEPGQRITLPGSGVVLRVSGVADNGTYGHADVAFTPLATWQQISAGGRAQFSAVALRLRPGTDVAAADAAAGTETYTKTGANRGSPGYTAETATTALIRGFLYVIVALVLGAFFVVEAIERARQIALLKALGASTTYVLRSAILQAGIVLVVAATAGALLGSGAGRLVGHGIPFSLRAGNVIEAAALLITFGMIGALTPVRRIARVDPITALGVER